MSRPTTNQTRRIPTHLAPSIAFVFDLSQISRVGTKGWNFVLRVITRRNLTEIPVTDLVKQAVEMWQSIRASQLFNSLTTLARIFSLQTRSQDWRIKKMKTRSTVQPTINHLERMGPLIKTYLHELIEPNWRISEENLTNKMKKDKLTKKKKSKLKKNKSNTKTTK
jgi:hypothetical protein